MAGAQRVAPADFDGRSNASDEALGEHLLRCYNARCLLYRVPGALNFSCNRRSYHLFHAMRRYALISVYTCGRAHAGLVHVYTPDVLESLGFGTMQWRLFGVCGLAFMADAMEIMLLSFLSEQVRVEWCLSKTVSSTIASAVFAGELLGCMVLGGLADRFGTVPLC